MTLPVFGFIKPTVFNYLNLNIFVLSHTIQVKNQEEHIHERIGIVAYLFFVRLTIRGKKNIKTGISEGANHYKVC